MKWLSPRLEYQTTNLLSNIIIVVQRYEKRIFNQRCQPFDTTKNMAKNEADNNLFIPCYILLTGQ